MITDARENLSGELEAEVCVVGAGPAGIVLALELVSRGRQVVLLEGGAVEGPGDAQSVYEGENSGRHYPLSGSRLRWLGGTSNHWGGWVKPLDDIDFEEKPHYPLPGWPLTLEDFAAWYARAAQWCEVGSDDYAPEGLGWRAAGRLLELGRETGFVHRMFRFSPPTRFGQQYRDALQAEALLDCRVNLNAIELEQGEDQVRALLARTTEGRRCRIRSRHFVLAMGGIENARFLLNQSPVPGNQSGLIGCCFMDHFGYSPGTVLTGGDLVYERGRLKSDDVMVVLAPGRELIRSGLRNCCIMLQADEPDPLIGKSYWRQPLLGDKQDGAMHRLVMINEPLPHTGNRLTLSDQRDMFGMHRAHLHWELPAAEYEPALKLFDYWTREVSAAGLGRVRQTRTGLPGPGDHIGLGYHHMGTTRMSVDPEFGAADPEGRLWDRDNLYVAGSSLFPHAGYSNPTLTIVALAARLAGYLDRRLEAGS